STMMYTQRGEVVVVDVDHGWRGLNILPGEQIDVHVLVGDDDHTNYSYARLSSIAAAPGDTVDLGIVEAAPLLASAPITIGASGGAGAIIDWRWTTSVALELDGDGARPEAAMPLATVAAASTTLRVPLIPGARVRAGVSASHPRGEEQGGFFRATESWSGVQRLGSDALGVDVVVGPEMVRPATGAIFSRRGLGFEWNPAGKAALSTLTVVDTAHGAARFRIVTNGHEVPLARLIELGLPKLELGDHILDLSTSPLVGVDDALSPDVNVRRRRADRTQPGFATYLRVPFQVAQ
ncbi:MAG: hypothetical protein K0S65_4468, partial [Labilithrix sp.]|nr:hypothetical protein [Labilithrix sp.]